MKILLVEDDKNLREGLQDLLEIESYEVVTASDGNAGFDLFRNLKPDFCILDVMLPGLDGYSLCRKIRADSQLPIMLLSARVEEFDRVLGFESGADDYVCKPFSPRELIARITAIARRANPAIVKEDVNSRAACLTMAGIKLDCAAQRAYRGDDVIDLMEREVKILKLLYDRAGDVVRRDEIFDLCWGRDFMPNSRALDQYISSLRSKLSVDSKLDSIIQTVRGVGYRFDVNK